MKIENIDRAKEINDEIKRMNRLLESDKVANVTVNFYDKTGYRREIVLLEEAVIEAVKQQVKNKKDSLENKLNKLL